MSNTNPYNTSLTTVGTTTTDQQAYAAARTCAEHATNPQELTELLDMLGILEEKS